jgi:hypothetical protein
MHILRNIILFIFAIFITLLAIAYCSFYFCYERNNIFKEQTIFTNKSNDLAILFINNYDSGKIDSIVYKLERCEFWVGHSKWIYNHKLFGKENFSSYIDLSQTVLVCDDYYFDHKKNKKAKAYEIKCLKGDGDIFNSMKVIRNNYGLNKIQRRGRVFIFNNGIAYFKGSENEMYIESLPKNIRNKAIKLKNNWYKIPKPD